MEMEVQTRHQTLLLLLHRRLCSSLQIEVEVLERERIQSLIEREKETFDRTWMIIPKLFGIVALNENTIFDLGFRLRIWFHH